MGGHCYVKYLGSSQKPIMELPSHNCFFAEVNAKNVSGFVWDLVPFQAG